MQTRSLPDISFGQNVSLQHSAFAAALLSSHSLGQPIKYRRRAVPTRRNVKLRGERKRGSRALAAADVNARAKPMRSARTPQSCALLLRRPYEP